MSKKAPAPPSPFPRRMRDNIEAAAMAVLLAVGLKYFVVEAYEIPTPSMQPTLMGSRETGIYDRILVNKAAFLVREPHRWDVAVFRYPHNRSQNYVKRIVGMPGEQLKIVGGDVYRRRPDGGFEILRKPLGLQSHLWKPMYSLADDPKPKDSFHFNLAEGRWRIEDGDVVAEDTGQGARTEFMPADEPLNHYWHGYPERLREAVTREGQWPGHAQAVGDLQWQVTVVPGAGSREVVLTEVERPTAGMRRELSLTIGIDGTEESFARLEVSVGSASTGGSAPQQKLQQEVRGIGFAAGRALDVVFVNSDDRLVAWVGGTQLGPLEYDPGTPGMLDGADLKLACRGGTARFRGVTLARDLYYLPSSEEPEKVFAVPDDHYWMLGDNTKRSDDGRSWAKVTVWVRDDGTLAPKGQGRPLVGNARYMYRERPNELDPDENPVVVPSHQRIVFTDEWGEEHVLRGTPGDLEATMETSGEGDTRFVPREFMVGRAFARFWPINPFQWFRVGLIR